MHYRRSAYVMSYRVFLARQPRLALLLCDEVGLRTRVQSKMWEVGRTSAVYSTYSAETCELFLGELLAALFFDLRFRCPFSLLSRRQALAHLWSESCWRSLEANVLLSEVGSLPVTDSAVSAIALSGIMHCWFVDQDQPGCYLSVSPGDVLVISSASRTLNWFPSFTLRPEFEGVTQYRRRKQAVRKLLLLRCTQPLNERLASALGLGDSSAQALCQEQLPACSFRDAASCFDSLPSFVVGNGPVAPVVTAGLLFRRHLASPWERSIDVESEDEYVLHPERLAYHASSMWLGHSIRAQDYRLTEPDSIFRQWSDDFVPRSRDAYAAHADASRSSHRGARSRSRADWAPELRMTGRLSSEAPARRSFQPN